MITDDMAPPTANAGNNDVFACADAFVTLSASASSGQGTLSYVWTNSSGTVIGNEETIDVTESGDFTVVVTDSDNGCTAESFVTITPDEDKPVINIAEPDMLTCGVGSVVLDATNTTGVGQLTYMWMFNGQMIGTGETIMVSTPGIYMLNVVDGSNGCDENSSIEVELDDLAPTFSVMGGETDCFSGATDVIINDLVATNPSFSWEGPNGCLLYTSPSPRDQRGSRMPSSA